MKKFIEMQSTAEQWQELQVLIQWGAPEKHRKNALALAGRYRDDHIALRLLTAFYSYLPDAVEDWIDTIGCLRRRQGFFLLCARTPRQRYLYLVNVEEAIFLGPVTEGIWDEDVLEFFGWKDNEASKKDLAAQKDIPEYQPAIRDPDLCPVCLAGKGEHHILGCPVEICPWCGGHLTRCDCRFRLLGRQRVERDIHIDRLYEALEKKGRIPFDPASQSPAHPAAAARLAGKQE